MHDVEPVEQVLAERAGAHRLAHVAVRGGEDADVHRYRLRSADAVDDALLERAQELGLEPHVHLGNLVEQQRAAVGFLELADPPRHRAGEGALLVAEQFAFQKCVGDGGAVHAHERLRAPGRALVQVAREHLLASAALAGDQNGRVRARHLLGELDHLLHGGIAPDEGGVVGDHRLQDRRDHVGVRRQRDVLLRPRLDRRDGCACVRSRAAGDDGRTDALRFQRADEVGDGERDVDHDQVGALGAQDGEALVDVVGLDYARAAGHGDAGGRRQLAVQPADDEQAHGTLLNARS